MDTTRFPVIFFDGVTPEEVARVFGKTELQWQIALLRIAQLLTAGLRVRRLHHRDGSLQGKVQYGFRGQLDLLALAGGLRSATHAGARCGTDGSALTATRDRANDAANDRPSAYLFGCVLAARTAFFPVLVGLQVVALAVCRDAVELQHHYGLSRELARALDFDNVPCDVGAGWDRFRPFGG